MDKTTKSRQLYRLLVERASRLEDGARFPTLREIMSEYNVSQFTAAPALKWMQQNGLIVSYVGRGSFVTRGAVSRKGARILYLRPDWPSHSIEAMERTMTGEALSRGYCCEVVRYPVDADIYRKLPDFESDAVILDPVRFDSFTAEQLQILTSSVRPIVLCRSTLPVFNIKCVGSHLTETGMTAANYLYRRGHRRIGVLLSEGPSYTLSTMTGTLRLCAATLGCEVSLFDAEIRKGVDSCIQTRSYLERGGDEILGSGISALFVCSYATAREVLAFFERRGVDIPGKLSLLSYGFDSIPDETPRISSVDSPLPKQAAAVLDIIDHQLSGDLAFPCQICIKPEILEYQSVSDINTELRKEAVS